MKIAKEYANEYALQENTDFAVKEITAICNEIGPRRPGSPEELKAQERMQKTMDEFCDSTKIEPFTLHRQGFMGFIPFTVCCGIAATFVNYFASPLIALILCVLAIIPLVFEFLMYKQFDDFLFPKQTSHNLISTIKPKGEVKKRIVLIGHSDSQFEWNINYMFGSISKKGGKLALLVVELPAVIGLVLTTFIATASLIMMLVTGHGLMEGLRAFSITPVSIVLFAIGCVFAPFEFSFIFFQDWRKSVPGASDNLSGCYTGMLALKAIKDAGIEFENTEVQMICSGSEEAGLRGSKAYAKEHEKELKEIPTAVIALDTFRDLEDMAVYDRDLSGTVQHDWGVKHLVKNAAKNCGFDLKFSSIYVGGSDAASFTQRKIPATGFAAMNPDPPNYYHTRRDTPENMRPECITAGIEIMVEAICMYDKEGLPTKESK